MENFIIRPANPTDVTDIFSLIQGLAEYEQLSHQVTGTPEDLKQHLFGEKPYAEAIIAH